MADATLDDAARALDRHARALAAADVVERASGRADVSSDDARMIQRRRTRDACVDALDAADHVLDDAERALATGGGDARAVERLKALRTRARDGRADAEAFGRGERVAALGGVCAPPRVVESVDVGVEGRGTSIGSVFRALAGRMGTATVTTRAGDGDGRAGDGDGRARYSRQQREREAHSGVETRGVRRGEASDETSGGALGFSGDGATRGTWFAGAKESLARVDIAGGDAPRERPASRVDSEAADRDELFGGRARATSTSTPSRVADAARGYAAERDQRLDAARGAARLDATSDVLAQCADALADTESVGASVLATLAAQRESLVRSGTAARRATRDADVNLKIVTGMNSWTRLGR